MIKSRASASGFLFSSPHTTDSVTLLCLHVSSKIMLSTLAPFVSRKNYTWNVLFRYHQDCHPFSLLFIVKYVPHFSLISTQPFCAIHLTLQADTCVPAQDQKPNLTHPGSKWYIPAEADHVKLVSIRENVLKFVCRCDLLPRVLSWL